MNDAYLTAKAVHIISATILFGTGLGTAFSMWRADRSGDVHAIATVARSVVVADWLFTLPAVIVQPLSGGLLMKLLGYDFHQSWIVAAIILYFVAGCCWIPVVWLQVRIDRIASAARKNGADLPIEYRRCMNAWYALGWPAFAAVLASFFLMIFKPRLW